MAAEESIERIKITNDFYQILNVPRDSSEDVIKKAYREMALLLHPDKCKVAGSEDAFKSVSAAYSCLSDSEHRKAYDKYGHEGHESSWDMDDRDFDPEDLFRSFFAMQFGDDGPPPGFDPFDFMWDEYDLRPAHRRARADWGSVARASTDKVNCPVCGKHLPVIDVRYDGRPFYSQEIHVCRLCNRQLESLKTEVKETVSDGDGDGARLSFRFPKTGKTKGKAKATFRADKGWITVERGDFMLVSNTRSTLGF